MAIEKVLIELTETDVKDIVCKHYGLDANSATISINITKGDRPFDRDFTTIKVTGEKRKGNSGSYIQG